MSSNAKYLTLRQDIILETEKLRGLANKQCIKKMLDIFDNVYEFIDELNDKKIIYIAIMEVIGVFAISILNYVK